MNKMQVIIMTKSIKYGGLCIAGFECETGNWVRLVSNQTITNRNFVYGDKSIINILDKIEINILGSAATDIHKEDVYVDLTKPIIKLSAFSLRQALNIHSLENSQYVLGNNKHVIYQNPSYIGHSLEIVKVSNAVLYEVEGPHGIKAKLDFSYNGNYYENLSITDPEYFGMQNRTKLGEVIIVVSIPDDEWSKNNGYFKFVAKIFK